MKETRVRSELTKNMAIPPRSNVEHNMVKHAAALLQHSYGGLYLANRILFPERATIRYPEFNPDKIKQVIAVVNIPARVDGREMVLSHPIIDGDNIGGIVLSRKS